MNERHITAAVGTALALSLVAVAIVAICVHSVQADESVSSPFGITAHDPPANEVGVALTADVQATFDEDVNAGTVTNDTFVVHGHLGGLASGSFSYHAGSRTVTLDPARAFHAGEVLRVSATSGISSTGGGPLTPYGWQFTAGPVRDRRFAAFAEMDVGLAAVSDSAAAWGDYDNDGDLDILLTGQDGADNPVSKLYRNDGASTFTDISAFLPASADSAVAWGDHDNDGDLDILWIGLQGSISQANLAAGLASTLPTLDDPVSEVWRNDGGGTFIPIWAGLIGAYWGSVDWGDYDNDGDLDILLTGLAETDTSYAPTSKVYRNDGGGAFTDIGAALIDVYHSAVAWGDYDNDGDLDILLTGLDVANRHSRVYRNDGGGIFSDIGAGLAIVVFGAVDWGDYDNDGDLDILLMGQGIGTDVTNVYRNDGASGFTDIGAGLTGLQDGTASWGDYDNDGDLDILLTGQGGGATTASKVYRNDGASGFVDIGADLVAMGRGSAAWGDADNDGDLDILLTGKIGTYPDETLVTRIYRNNSTPKLGTVTPSSGSGATGVTTYFTTTWSDPDGWENLKQCYFHIGDSPSLAGNVTLLYNAAKDRLWLLDDTGTSWLGGCSPGEAVAFANSQAGLNCHATLVQSGGDRLGVRWALEFFPGFAGSKKLGLKCKDRDKAKAKGRWKGTWTIE